MTETDISSSELKRKSAGRCSPYGGLFLMMRQKKADCLTEQILSLPEYKKQSGSWLSLP